MWMCVCVFVRMCVGGVCLYVCHCLCLGAVPGQGQGGGGGGGFRIAKDGGSRNLPQQQ